MLSTMNHPLWDILEAEGWAYGYAWTHSYKHGEIVSVQVYRPNSYDPRSERHVFDGIGFVRDTEEQAAEELDNIALYVIETGDVPPEYREER